MKKLEDTITATICSPSRHPILLEIKRQIQETGGRHREWNGQHRTQETDRERDDNERKKKRRQDNVYLLVSKHFIVHDHHMDALNFANHKIK